MSLRDDMATDISGGSVFYDIESGWAESATVYSTSLVVPVLFDLEYYDSETGDLVMGTRAPRCWIRSSDAPVVGDSLTIRSVQYQVTHTEPNGDGESYLYLQKVTNPLPPIVGVIDSFVVTVGDFFSTTYGFSSINFFIGSINPATVNMSNNTICIPVYAAWGFDTVFFSVDDQSGPLENSDESAFKQLAIVENDVDIIVLERSAASSYNENGSGVHAWQWSGQTLNPYGTVVGATRIVELRS